MDAWRAKYQKPNMENHGGAVTLDEMIEEVKRECEMRRKVFPKWVRDGKKSQREAQAQIRVMDAVLDELMTRKEPKLL